MNMTCLFTTKAFTFEACKFFTDSKINVKKDKEESNLKNEYK